MHIWDITVKDEDDVVEGDAVLPPPNQSNIVQDATVPLDTQFILSFCRVDKYYVFFLV